MTLPAVCGFWWQDDDTGVHTCFTYGAHERHECGDEGCAVSVPYAVRGGRWTAKGERLRDERRERAQ